MDTKGERLFCDLCSSGWEQGVLIWDKATIGSVFHGPIDVPVLDGVPNASKSTSVTD
jgi:hypothetical protein